MVFIKELRIVLEKNQKGLSETNVGAGLPLIDTIKLLHLSGENITKKSRRGVFSELYQYYSYFPHMNKHQLQHR
jgi:aspartokinase/homoserine dehydrogenase 1